MSTCNTKLNVLRLHHEALLAKPNHKVEFGNGIYDRYENPILTAEHTPLEWRYDMNERTTKTYLSFHFIAPELSVALIIIRCIKNGFVRSFIS